MKELERTKVSNRELIYRTNNQTLNGKEKDQKGEARATHVRVTSLINRRGSGRRLNELLNTMQDSHETLSPDLNTQRSPEPMMDTKASKDIRHDDNDTV